MPDNRRPIAARNLAVSRHMTDALCRMGASPNGISLAGMVAGLVAGGLLAATAYTAGVPAALAWLGGAGLIVARLVANMLDGMVAVQSGRTSRLGELMNEVPDRVSDTAILVGLGYAAGGAPILGYAAALAAMATAYVRSLGMAVTGKAEFCGPMAKQQRMAVTIAIAVLAAAMALFGRPPVLGGVAVPAAALALITLGAIWTTWRRLVRVARLIPAR